MTALPLKYKIIKTLFLLDLDPRFQNRWLPPTSCKGSREQLERHLGLQI